MVQEEPHQEKSQQLLPAANSASIIAIGLRAAAEETSARNDRRGLLKLARAIESGGLHDPELIELSGQNDDLRAIVRAGIQSGRLPHLLEEYLTTNRQTRSLWQGFYLSLVYPFTLMAISAGVLAFFVIWTVPMFKGLFTDFGIQLPWLTLALIALSDFLVAFWLPGVLVFLALGILFFFRHALPFARWQSQLFQALPWVGTSQRMVACSEFCSRLAVLVECRLPLDEAMQIVSRSVHDAYYQHLAGQMARRIEAGESTSDLANFTPGIPQPLAHAFHWARDPKTFADGLRSLAMVFASQARLSSSQLIVIAEPIAIISVGVLSGTIVFAMFLPLVKLLNELS